MDDRQASPGRPARAHILPPQDALRFRLFADASRSWDEWLAADGSILYISPACERVTGYSPSAFRADPDLRARIVHPDDRAAWEEHWRAHADGTPGEATFRIRRPDGRSCWIAHECRPIEDESGRRCGARLSNRELAPGATADLAEALEQQAQRNAAVVGRLAAHLRRMGTELGEVELRERTRLARQLHDGLQPLIVAARMRLTLARRRAAGPLRPVLGEVDDILAQAIELSRSLTVDLVPPVFREQGLVAALHWLAGHAQERLSLRVHVTAEEEGEPGTEEVRRLFFRASQELVLNVAKHARTDEVLLALAREGEGWRLEICDQGKGFEPERLGEEEGETQAFGLRSLRQRVEALGGRMEIESNPGLGTRVSVRLPETGPPQDSGA